MCSRPLIGSATRTWWCRSTTTPGGLPGHRRGRHFPLSAVVGSASALSQPPLGSVTNSRSPADRDRRPGARRAPGTKRAPHGSKRSSRPVASGPAARRHRPDRTRRSPAAADRRRCRSARSASASSPGRARSAALRSAIPAQSAPAPASRRGRRAAATAGRAVAVRTGASIGVLMHAPSRCGVGDRDLVLGRVGERALGQRDVAALRLVDAVDGDHQPARSTRRPAPTARDGTPASTRSCRRTASRCRSRRRSADGSTRAGRRRRRRCTWARSALSTAMSVDRDAHQLVRRRARRTPRWSAGAAGRGRRTPCAACPSLGHRLAACRARHDDDGHDAGDLDAREVRVRAAGTPWPARCRPPASANSSKSSVVTARQRDRIDDGRALLGRRRASPRPGRRSSPSR